MTEYPENKSESTNWFIGNRDCKMSATASSGATHLSKRRQACDCWRQKFERVQRRFSSPNLQLSIKIGLETVNGAGQRYDALTADN